VAGSGGRELFEPDTFPVLYRYTGGIPRLINTLCDTALLAAFAQDRATVGLDDVRSAVAELQWVEYAARTHTQLQTMLDDTAPQEQLPVGRLVLTLKGATVTEVYLVPGRCVIGRTSDNDLQVESKYVSRHHAQVTTSSDGSWIEDLNSTNGIFVRGKRVRRHRFAEGDVVKIGLHELAYHKAEQKAADTLVMDVDDVDEDAEAEE
jgi:pSer/pThr/pTyr-binding forkhead associated (FHA) protein